MIVARHPLRIAIGDRSYELAEQAAAPGEFALLLDGRRVTGHRYDAGDRIFVRIAGRTFVVPRAERRAAGTANRDELRADMPGTVVALHVAAGRRVAAGDPLLTVESMKLQVVIAADRDAVVGRLPVAVGATFERGALLAVLAEVP